MSKAITLAREAGMGGDAFGWLASNHAIEKFYALARADLESENAKLKAVVLNGQHVIARLRYDNESAMAEEQFHEFMDAARAALVEPK